MYPQAVFWNQVLEETTLERDLEFAYRPKPWYGDGYVPQPSVLFSASEELGLFQGLGLGLKEEEAQQIIECIEEYRAEVGAASTTID